MTLLILSMKVLLTVILIIGVLCLAWYISKESTLLKQYLPAEGLMSSVHDVSIKPGDTVQSAIPRGGRLYPIYELPAEGCVVKKIDPYARGYYKYGCPTGECCKKSCCQVMPAKCTAGGGVFSTRFGNEGPPVTGEIPMQKMGKHYEAWDKGDMNTCDLCPTPYACPGCHLDVM